ncbi:hypothetical protein [Nocardia concava]|uniref:hypothetical protein n=1 Tax=Nocardia concava TaxID=257281 RepID=UPI0002DDC013|nr:hypothetical protein [Nocardia concava]
MRNTIGTVLSAAAALTILPGTATAAPADSDRVYYTAALTDSGLNITTDAGTLVEDQGVFKVKAADGTVLAGTELSFRVDDFVFPITAAINGHNATLTPRFDRDHAVYQPVALPYENQAPWKNEYDRELAAWARLGTTMQTGAAIGTLVGGIGGAAVGCVLGGIAGATVASATLVGLFGPFVPAAVLGCLGGIAVIGPLGTIAGQILITAPVTILAAIQYFTTINSPLPNTAK